MSLNRIDSNFHGQVLTSRSVGGFQLSEITFEPDVSIPLHWHERSFVSLVMRGGYTETHGIRKFVRPTSTLAFHPPALMHADQIHKTGAREFICEFKPIWLAQYQMLSTFLNRPVDTRSGMLVGLGARLYHEFHRVDPISPLVIEGLILELIGELARQNTKARGRVAPRWLKQAKEILRSALPERTSLITVSTVVGVHPVHLAREFRRYYRCTAGEYVRRISIDHACALLSGSDVPLAEIASRIGYSDQSHFTRTFKRLMRMTPTQYRAVVRAR